MYFILGNQIITSKIGAHDNYDYVDNVVAGENDNNGDLLCFMGDIRWYDSFQTVLFPSLGQRWIVSNAKLFHFLTFNFIKLNK